MLRETYIAVDPLEPLLGAMTSREVLEIIDDGNVLGLGGAEEVVLDRIGACRRSACGLEKEDWDILVAEGDLDGALEAVSVSVVAGTLVRLVLLHQGE
jgi:hypothetical protein